jgi:hypothetical protein
MRLWPLDWLYVLDVPGRAVHSQGSHQVPVVPLINTCDLFKNNPSPIISSYREASQTETIIWRNDAIDWVERAVKYGMKATNVDYDISWILQE